MRVLVACEWSGTVRDAFRRRGHEAWSCDLLGPDDLRDEFKAQEWPNYHLQGDVRELFNVFGWQWDLLIAHPPCQYLCNSGVRWLYKDGHKEYGRDPKRWKLMEQGAELFDWLASRDVPHICLENSIMHEYATDRIGRSPTQIIQPWMFGHGETKATALYLKALPKLQPTNIVEGREPVVHYASPGPDRGRIRGRTYRGVADAMAEQWGVNARYVRRPTFLLSRLRQPGRAMQLREPAL